MILSGTNEYTGDTSLTAGTLTLAGSGVLRFANTGTGGTGLFNSIGGSAGTLNLDGTLFFDLAGASTTPGTTWNIVTGRRSTSSTEARLRSRVRPGPSPGMLACGRSWTGPTRGRSSRWEARCR